MAPPTTPHGSAKSGARGVAHIPVGQRYLASLTGPTAGSAGVSRVRRVALPAAANVADDGEALDMLVLGMDVGPQMDAVECSLCEFNQETPESPLKLKILKHDSLPIPREIRVAMLTAVHTNKSNPPLLSQVNTELGTIFSNAAHDFSQRHRVVLDSVDLLGISGYTGWFSTAGESEGGRGRTIMTLGDGTVVAAKTGVTTVEGFRAAEQAVGRHGGPSVSFFDGLALKHKTRLRICQYIGQVSSVLFVPGEGDGGLDTMAEWDCGPGTILIDAAMRKLSNGQVGADKDGEWGRKGKVDMAVVTEFLKRDPFANRRPPKTVDCESIWRESHANLLIEKCLSRGLDPYDTVATITKITSLSITHSYRCFGPPHASINHANVDIVLCGPGATNENILHHLSTTFPLANITTYEDIVPGFSEGMRSAAANGLKAVEAVLGRASTVPCNAATTRPNTVTGRLCPGLKWRETMMKGLCFGGGGRGWEGLPEVREMVVEVGERN